MSEQTGTAGATRGSARAPRPSIPVEHEVQARSPSRRRVLTLGSGMAALGVAAGSGYLLYRPSHDRQLVYGRISDAMQEVNRLHAASPQAMEAAAWNWSQTLEHCAQSIEFSMQGFPVPKSALFQNTAGAAAFSVFAWRGRMSHNLAEPIPGAPALDAHSPDASAAFARLHASVKAFAVHEGPLQPHFAYGPLTRPQYEQAHAMHLANHLSLFDVRAAA
ncbi:DUF1569 domain-containing protein [Acidovorax sp. sic0104]|uniref:DUF1569 domain-containing protein n=1 Tax=Acidovorax sp. sic0104 TaxID=2854784 RepID=UPI0021054C7E|nr:DUF1569 domain-containing protein [Acidovorax sp. sic0104]